MYSPFCLICGQTGQGLDKLKKKNLFFNFLLPILIECITSALREHYEIITGSRREHPRQYTDLSRTYHETITGPSTDNNPTST